MTVVMWVILVGPVFGGRCGAEALGLGLGLSLGPAYRFALPPGLAAKTTRCLVFDQGRPTSHLHYLYLPSRIELITFPPFSLSHTFQHNSETHVQCSCNDTTEIGSRRLKLG